MDKIGAYSVPGIPLEKMRKYTLHLVALKHSKPKNIKERIDKKIDLEKELIDTVVNIICKFFMIEPWIVKSKSRKRPGVIIRQLIQKYCDENKLGSKNSIASQTGEGDHANVYNSVKKVNSYLNLPIYYIFFNNNFSSSELQVVNKSYVRTDKVSEVYNDMVIFVKENLNLISRKIN